MKLCAQIAVYLLLLQSLLSAADFDPLQHVCDRQGWGAKPAKNDLELRTTYDCPKASKIVIGHTVHKVTRSSDSKEIMRSIQVAHMGQGFNFDDIAYNCCLDQEGECFECRPYDKVPSLLKGHNADGCAVGLIGRFDEHEDSQIITDEMVKRFGKQLGRIAYEKLGFSSLERNKNIFAMSELSDRYPLSPGKRFMDRFDEIVKIANQEIEKRLKQ